MPKKKSTPAEEPMQPDGMPEQPETGAEDFPPPMDVPLELPPEEPPQGGDVPDGGASGGDVPKEDIPALPDDTGLPEGDSDNPSEVVDVDIPVPAEPPAALPMDEPPMEPQEPAPAEDVPPYGQDGEDAPPPAPAPADAPPMTDRQSFFALDFREVDRGLTAEERQAWNSIYASFRGHSALSGKIIGADPHSMNVRNKETGAVERRTMYCVVVLLYRVPIYIPATEMWTGEARPDYVLRNMMGSTIDFIITKVDREGGYAIASRRQAARAQRYFFAHRPDLCRTGARVKCRLLAVGPRRCLAECYGHDIDLTQRELSYTAIADLREQYHPGDELDCIVKGYDAPRRESRSP